MWSGERDDGFVETLVHAHDAIECGDLEHPAGRLRRCNQREIVTPVSRGSLCLHEGAQCGGVDERAFREDDDEIVAVQLLELSVEYRDGREVELADDVENSRAVGAVRAKNESGSTTCLQSRAVATGNVS